MGATAKFTSVSLKTKKCDVPLYAAVTRADPREKKPFDAEEAHPKASYSLYLISKGWVIFGEDSKGLVCLFVCFGLPQSAEYFVEAKVLPQRKQGWWLMGTLCKVHLRDRW